MSTFGILVGGGPAPGLNGVIGAATTVARRRGHKVVGILDGFNWIMQGDTSRTRELTEADVASIHLQGGSVLHTSRANPQKDPAHLANVVKSLDALGVDHLITIGGDDTASSANRVAEEAGGIDGLQGLVDAAAVEPVADVDGQVIEHRAFRDALQSFNADVADGEGGSGRRSRVGQRLRMHDTAGRAVSVHAAAIETVLRDLYDAGSIADEMMGVER